MGIMPSGVERAASGVNSLGHLFARWGDNIDYHIGDLSHALFRFKAYREPKRSYERWAATLFEAPGSTRLVQPVSLYVVPWYTYSKGPSGNVCSVKQVTQELIDLAYTQFAGMLLNVRRRPSTTSPDRSHTPVYPARYPRPGCDTRSLRKQR